MKLKVKRPTRFTLNGKTISVRPHNTVAIPDAAAKKLLSEHGDNVKKAK